MFIVLYWRRRTDGKAQVFAVDIAVTGIRDEGAPRHKLKDHSFLC